MREKITRIVMITVDLFAALSAFVGAVGLVVGFMNIPLSVLNGTPFADFTVPALLLGVVVGGSALAAAIIALARVRTYDALATAAAGGVMVVWMTVEITMIGLGTWVQLLYLVLGLVMVEVATLVYQEEWRHEGMSGRHSVA